MKKILISKLILIVVVIAKDEQDARGKAREELFNRDIRLINGSFRIEVRERAKGLFVCDVLNNYFVEHLSFFDSLRNLFCIINAATFNIGNRPTIVVIE